MSKDKKYYSSTRYITKRYRSKRLTAQGGDATPISKVTKAGNEPTSYQNRKASNMLYVMSDMRNRLSGFSADDYNTRVAGIDVKISNLQQTVSDNKEAADEKIAEIEVSAAQSPYS